ncbi:hypothetical protein M413DRAFT_135251 [Hebeloma cylindrosporum]|uniref:Uncharacterized protein n=1 Tax=Hebeloma cylindrosporum TaxID=76867 RepID=A0A0C2X9I6_HEBCY|nr:hypothetical protein M413DRAFT_135251 [Hebeloma cylindrosporum h7]
MRLLPGDRICVAVASSSSVTLYHRSDIQATTHVSPSNIPIWPSPSQPLHTWRLDTLSGSPQSYSQLYCCKNENTLRLVFTTDRAIYGVIFSCDNDIEFPKVIKLLDFKYAMFGYFSLLSLGYNTAIRSEGTSHSLSH